MAKENKKKRKRRRILLSLLMILFCGVILSTSTYAWFTANKTVTINDITVNVAAMNGLQISVDAINWKPTITTADIRGAQATYPTAVNQLPSELSSLSPVSSVGDIDTSTGFMQMYAGEIQTGSGGGNILTATRSTETHGENGNFIAFDVFIQTTALTQVYLTSNSRVTASGASSGIENEARIAFINEGNAATGTEPTTIQQLKSTGTPAPFIWEVNNDVHTAAAVQNANSVYHQTTQQTDADPLEYYGVKADIGAGLEIPLDSQDGTYFEKVTPSASTGVDGIPTTAYQSLMQLQPGITKVRIYMWVEGQDVDCENNASGGSLTFSLQISSNTSADGA